MNPRQALITIVSDPARTPGNILGAAISYVRMQGDPLSKILAETADKAIMAKIAELRALKMAASGKQ